MIHLSASAAQWFLPLVIPVALWVSWSDLALLKIPNRSVLALIAVYAVVGLAALPGDQYLWQWLHLPVVLTIGFAINLGGLMGAGDAKFAAAAAPFVAAGDLPTALYLLAGVTLIALACHRAVRSIPLLRSPVGHWRSWHGAEFPMGVSLGASLTLYLILAAFGDG
ncbi:prepilin peptidase [Tropicimonas sp.]|uniref:prepilin peptidase n=1 Tax=Tropicimonas sp. TaxID=2067044 RepID=UPI003A8B2873